MRRGNSTTVFVLYPLIPWIGVMAAGYALGHVMELDAEARRRQLLRLGTAITTGFVLLRATNLYGDPAPWTMQDTWSATVLSFVNCEKYPPSLLFLMMTLGPALMLLIAFENVHGRLAQWLITWTGTFFLLCCSFLPYPRTRGRVCPGNVFIVIWFPFSTNACCCPELGSCLPRMAFRADFALSTLSLVCGAQAAPY